MNAIDEIIGDLKRSTAELGSVNSLVDDAAAKTAAEIRSLKVQLAECLAGTTPPDPPVIQPPDPPVNPPAGERPGEELDWNVRPVQTNSFHWIVRGQVAIHQATQYAVDLEIGGLGDAYRYSRQHGDEGMIMFGVIGRGGVGAVGGRYGTTGRDDMAYPGEELPSAGFVGLTPDASIQFSFTFAGNSALTCGNVGVWNIGCRGASDSFIIRTSGSKNCKDVTFDGCWWLAADDREGLYTSGLHITGWDRFVMRNHLWRGQNPGDPGLKFREHSGAYLKDGRISTLLEFNDLYGGNRTFSQKRPQAWLDEAQTIPKNPLPTDRYMARGNYGRNLGDNWRPDQSDGGAALTTWVSAAGTYIYDNDIENFRYKAISIGGQPAWKNYDHLVSGNQHDKVYVAGNRLIRGPLTERGTIGFSSCDLVHVYDDNVFTGRVTFNTKTNNGYNGTRNVEQKIITRTGRPNWDIQTVTEDGSRERPMTDAEVNAMLVRG